MNEKVLDLLRRGRIDLAVDYGRHVRSDNLDGGLAVAKTHATRLADEDVGETLLVERVDKRGESVFCAGGDSARAHSHDDLHVLIGAVAHIHRLLLLFAHAAKVVKCQLCHFRLSLKFFNP